MNNTYREKLQSGRLTPDAREQRVTDLQNGYSAARALDLQGARGVEAWSWAVNGRFVMDA
jgi:hypothetical protein